MSKLLSRIPPTFCVIAEKIFAQLFWLMVFAVQAPLLGPRAFGLVAIVMVFVGFWEAVPGMATIDALISVRNIDHLHFSTVTTTCALFCLAFGIVVFEFAEPVATVLGDVKLTSVMHAMAVLPLIQAFSIAPTAAAERELRFQSTALRTIASLFAAGVVGLALTLIGAGVWALVWQALVQRFIAAIVLWVAVPIPLRFAISRRHFRELAGFALPVMLARSMSWASGQIPRVILGFYLGPTELGLFSLATRLNDIVTSVAVGPRALVARVDLRRFAASPEDFAEAARRISFHISLSSFPLFVGGAAVAPTLFHAWLDPRWYEAIIPSQLVLLMGVPLATFYIGTALLLALNRQNWEAGVSTAQSVGIVIAVAVSARFGLVATAAACAALPLAMLPLPILAMHRQCGLSLRDSLLPQAPAFAAACLMGIAVLLLRKPLEAALPAVTALPILISAGATLYLILLAVMTPKRVVKLLNHLINVIVEKLTVSIRIRKFLRSFGIEWLLYYHHHRHFVHAARGYRRDGTTMELLAKLRNMNLVFTVTAGRSGTLFAQKLFSLLPEVTSEHEPQPAFHVYLRRIRRDPVFAREFLLHYKLPVIGNLHTPNYVELSHVFCKGFLEPLLELGVTPNLLLLRRDPRLVALSYLARYTVPERTFYGIEFLLSPRYAGTLPLPDWQHMTDYQLIFWYALEIERRQREYSRLVRVRGGIVCDVTAVELNDFECFFQLVQTLGLLTLTADRNGLDCQHASIARFSRNRNGAPQRHYRVDLDREEEEVWRVVSAAEPQLRFWVERRYRGH